MNSKEKMFRVLRGEETDVMPVGAHAWGLYKFQLEGLINGYEDEDSAWATGGEDLARIEENYYRKIIPDFLHLSEGPCVYPKHKMQAPEYRELMRELRLLESKSVIDTFVNECYPEPEAYLSGPRFEHVRLLADRLGDEVFIALHNATPVNDVFDNEGFLGGFQEAMISSLEKTEILAYLVYETHMKHLDYQRALAACGAHAHISTEGYMSADLVSPSLYEKILFGAQKDYYKGVRATGLIPIMCFWGNVNPLLKFFKQLDIDGLMIEESRKGFVIDAAEVKRDIGDGITIFGNLPGETLLLHGTPDEVAAGTREMIDSLDDKRRFIMCTGTPIAFDTPVENLHAMIEAARNC
jgi:uroporphyrinogen-III decarboxylase